MRDTDEPTRSVSRRGVLGGCAAAVTASLAGCSGSLDAESTITREYDAADLSTVVVDATNGDIDITLTGPADVTADTTNGDVSITVPAGAEPVIAFETTNGEFEATGLDAGSIEADGDIDRTIGDGTHRLSVDTTNGDFSIQGAA